MPATSPGSERAIAPRVTFNSTLFGSFFDSTSYVKVLVSTASGTPLCQIHASFDRDGKRYGCPVPVPSDIAVEISGYLQDSTLAWTGTTVQRVPEGDGAYSFVIYGQYVVRQESEIILGRTEAPVALLPFDPATEILRDTTSSVFGKRWIASPTPGAKIHYTTDGTLPSQASPILPELWTFPPGTRLIAFAKAEKMAPSPMFSAWIDMDPRDPAACTVSLSRNPGFLGYVVDASLLGRCPSGDILYTTNGTRPTAKSPSMPWRIELQEPARIRAILFDKTTRKEASAEADLNLLLGDAPRLVLWRLVDGLYVHLTDGFQGRILYTRDGRIPTSVDSSLPSREDLSKRQGGLASFFTPGMTFRGFVPSFGWTETLVLDGSDVFFEVPVPIPHRIASDTLVLDLPPNTFATYSLDGTSPGPSSPSTSSRLALRNLGLPLDSLMDLRVAAWTKDSSRVQAATRVLHRIVLADILDLRDGRTYLVKRVQRLSQDWFRSDLGYAPPVDSESVLSTDGSSRTYFHRSFIDSIPCPAESPGTCDAQILRSNLCPDGWRIPTTKDWEASDLGDSAITESELRSAYGVDRDGQVNTDQAGFWTDDGNLGSPGFYSQIPYRDLARRIRCVRDF